MVMVTLKLQRYFVIYIWASLKMQQIIKKTGPNRQLFEAVNFDFMKMFYSLVRIAIFRAFFLFLGDLRHAFWPNSNTWSRQKYMTWISLKKGEMSLRLKQRFQFSFSWNDPIQKVHTFWSLCITLVFLACCVEMTPKTTSKIVGLF